MHYLSHDQIVYAGFMRRLLAFILDALFVGVVTAVLFISIFGSQAFVQYSSASLSQINWPMLSLEHGLPLLWSVGFWMLWLATPGKLLMDCQVVDMHSFSKASIGQLLIRYFAYILSMLPLGLGFLWIVFDQRNQGWHDKLSKTVVIMQDDSLASLSALSAASIKA